MTWISKSITAIGFILLAHACYSAHEHSALYSLRSASPSSGASPSAPSGASSPSSAPATPAQSLPLDISIETVVALLVSCLGLVLGTPALRPIQWRVWAGKIEREGAEGFTGADGEVERDYIGNPFKMLETRPGFVDVRRQRRDFTEWVKAAGK